MLTSKEQKQLITLLKKIENPQLGLPQSVFDTLVKIVPFVSCELIIIGKKGVLLTWREDKWWKGWHVPGGLLRYRESFDNRIKKVADKELGIKIEKYKFLFNMNYTEDSRGHSVSFVFLCFTNEAPRDGQFFKKMPKDIIKEHVETWKELQKLKIVI